MTLRNKVLRSLGWAASAKGLGQIINWAMTLYVIRILSPEDYGLMAIAMMFITILLPVSELRLGSALVQRDTIDESLKKKIFGFVLTISGGLCLFLNLGANWISALFDTPQLAPILRVLSFALIIAAFAVVPRAVLQRTLDFKSQSIIDLIGAISGGIVAVVLASLHYGIWSLVWSYVTTTSITTIGMTIVTRPWPFPDFDFRGMRDVMKFGGWLTLSHFTWLISSQADIFIIGKLLGERMLGFYSVAKHIAQLPQNRLQGIINTVALPAYSNARATGDNPTYYLEKYLRLSSLIAFPVFAGLSCIAPEFVLLILGENWRTAILPLQLLSIVLPLRVIEYAFAPYLDALGKVETSFGNSAISLIIMIFVLSIGATMGLVGVSVAWSVGVVATFLLVLYRSARVTAVSVYAIMGIVAKMIVPTGVMYTSVSIVQTQLGDAHGLMVKLILEVGAGLVAYGSCAWILCRAEINEALDLLMPKKINAVKLNSEVDRVNTHQ